MNQSQPQLRFIIKQNTNKTGTKRKPANKITKTTKQKNVKSKELTPLQIEQLRNNNMVLTQMNEHLQTQIEQMKIEKQKLETIFRKTSEDLNKITLQYDDLKIKYEDCENEKLEVKNNYENLKIEFDELKDLYDNEKSFHKLEYDDRMKDMKDIRRETRKRACKK